MENHHNTYLIFKYFDIILLSSVIYTHHKRMFQFDRNNMIIDLLYETIIGKSVEKKCFHFLGGNLYKFINPIR